MEHAEAFVASEAGELSRILRDDDLVAHGAVMAPDPLALHRASVIVAGAVVAPYIFAGATIGSVVSEIAIAAIALAALAVAVAVSISLAMPLTAAVPFAMIAAGTLVMAFAIAVAGICARQSVEWQQRWRRRQAEQRAGGREGRCDPQKAEAH
jgi:hypothetical protein